MCKHHFLLRNLPFDHDLKLSISRTSPRDSACAIAIPWGRGIYTVFIPYILLLFTLHKTPSILTDNKNLLLISAIPNYIFNSTKTFFRQP